MKVEKESRTPEDLKAEAELREFLNDRGINLENFQEPALAADEFFQENAQEMNKIEFRGILASDKPRVLGFDEAEMTDLYTPMRAGLQKLELNSLHGRESEATFSEEAVDHFLSERGFEDLPITTSYSMEGEYYDAEEISHRPSAYHPTYEVVYEGNSGEIWTLSIIGKDITAHPYFFNQTSSLGAPLIVAESEMVTSYDSASNSFYESVPKESSLIVKVVDKIDKETLDSLTDEVMGQ